MIDFGHRNGCTSPDCAGCDPEYLEDEELRMAIADTKAHLKELEGIYKKRKKTGRHPSV